MKKILIVDDEQSFLLSLKDGLHKHAERFQVRLAANGREAVEILRTQQIDLLVTDLKMPIMNGFELLAWVSRHKPQLPVIVMSAFGTPEIEARLDRYDALQFLEKPLDLKMLEEGILNGLNTTGKSFIRGITLSTFLQLMKAEQKNCTLKVTAGSEPAFLFICRGELIDADYGSLKGLDAALEIVSWDDAEIEMDGICRRQEDVVKMPMEHLLIEAFKRKDEAAESQRTGQEFSSDWTGGAEGDPESASGSDRLTAVLAKIAAVQEFAVYDQAGSLLAAHPGKTALNGIDPAQIEALLGELSENLKLGQFRTMVLNTAKRQRYLLLYNESQRLLARLKAGAQANQVIKTIKQELEL